MADADAGDEFVGASEAAQRQPALEPDHLPERLLGSLERNSAERRASWLMPGSRATAAWARIRFCRDSLRLLETMCGPPAEEYSGSANVLGALPENGGQWRAMQLIDPARLQHADLFFHVLAHVEGTRKLPASVYSRPYVDWARSVLGDPERRTLADDARLLANAFPTHALLAKAQLLARLFESVERLASVGGKSLAELGPGDVDDPAALRHVQSMGQAAELAFCALALELPYFSRLPPPPGVPAALLDHLAELAPLAPSLASARVGCVRSLHQRGRIWRAGEIWVGHPEAEVGPSFEHAAWQAAHEATVVAVARESPALGERQVEAQAVTELASAAQALGQRAAHARWLANVRALA